MRIAFIADVRSPISRGWISHFIDRGHEVHVIATYPCSPELLTGASVTQLPIAFSKLARTRADGGTNSDNLWKLFRLSVDSRYAFSLLIYAWTWLSPLEIHRHTRTLRELLKDISPDIVHAMRIPFEGIIAAIATPNGTPLVTSVWGNDLNWIARQNPLVARQTRQVMQRTDGLHCDCFRDLHLARREWDLDEQKPTAVLPSSGGIKSSLFYPGESASGLREQLRIPEDAFVVINPRGFRGYVHNETFFKAIPSVMSEIPNVVFLCSAMQNNSLAEKWVRKLDIAPAVRLLPVVPREQMADLFRLSHVSVSPSVYDGTPNSLLESMACGCFPVAGNIESVREWVVDGENGLLCDPRSAEAVAQAILRALNDQGFRDSAREINIRLVDERADYDKVMLEAEEFYRRAIQRARAPVLVLSPDNFVEHVGAPGRNAPTGTTESTGFERSASLLGATRPGMVTLDNATLKAQVKQHWERETCGIRYAEAADRKEYFRQISVARYELEPYIPPFADFESATGKQVLEIGVGAGSDFENWCRYADHATGVDLTEAAIRLTTERLTLNGVPAERYTLRTADAENLPFEDNSFDIVYTWGVLLCTPDTERAYRETFRVLRPGGTIRTMVYHVPSWVGLQLYLLYGLGRGNPRATMKQVMFEHLESPGTKGYTVPEARQLLARCGFLQVEASTKLAVGDFLAIKLSSKYDSRIFKLLRGIYPRWLVRLMGDRYGTNLMMTGVKPDNSARG